MRCKQCDIILSDFEATRKDTRNGVYLDLCNRCYSYISEFIPVSERFDLYEGEFDESTMQDLWHDDETS